MNKANCALSVWGPAQNQKQFYDRRRCCGCRQEPLYCRVVAPAQFSILFFSNPKFLGPLYYLFFLAIGLPHYIFK